MKPHDPAFALKSEVESQKVEFLTPSLAKLKKDRFENRALTLVIALVAVLTVIDMISDLDEGVTVAHISFEAFMTALSLVGAFLLLKKNRALENEVKLQTKKVKEAQQAEKLAREQAEKWKVESAQILRGRSDAIDHQMEEWSLTQAEKEVTLLLLKGLSLKEVASVRGVSEKTARAQSFAIYAKSGLGGRAELSAFFLEDVMLPSAAYSDQELE